jgi:SOS response regulatory protein OraA/RecX
MSDSAEDFKSAKAEASAAKTKARSLRPWFKKKRFIIPIVLAVIIGISTASNQGDEGPATSSNETSNSTTPATIEADESQAEGSAETTFPNESISQENARKSAQSYLRSSSFSRQGLIDQLIFEEYSNEDAEYAVDVLKVNWSEQAAGSADSYLNSSSFSETGLVDQLVFGGFSQEEAEFGVAAANPDWMEQASKSAASYLRSSSFSRQGLIDQLIFEGFSQEEAEYGVSQNGY